MGSGNGGGLGGPICMVYGMLDVDFEVKLCLIEEEWAVYSGVQIYVCTF